MQKPADYDKTKAAHVIGKPRKGFYVFEILHAEEKMTKATEGKPSRPMLVLHLDIAEGPYRGYFMNKWKNDKKYQGDKAYYRAIHRRVMDDVERLKADVTAIEQSNNFKWDWDEQNLIGKKIGGAIGEYEYYSVKNSTIMTDIEFRYLLPISRAMSGELDPPATKKLKQDNSFNDQGCSDSDEPLPEYVDSQELPF